MLTFSALGYYFGKNLHQKLNIPIGLVLSCWGGTPIRSWINRKSLKNNRVPAQYESKLNTHDSIYLKTFPEYIKNIKNKYNSFENWLNQVNNIEKTKYDFIKNLPVIKHKTSLSSFSLQRNDKSYCPFILKRSHLVSG